MPARPTCGARCRSVPDLLPLQLNLVKALAKAGRKDEARSQLDALMPRLQEGTPMHQGGACAANVA